MRKLICIIGLLFMIFVLGMYNSYAQEEQIKAEVIDVKGNVTVKKSGGEKSFKVVKGMYILEGYIITTGLDSYVDIKISDKREVKVSEKTIFVVEKLKQTKEKQQSKISVITGAVWANVKKKLNKLSSFEIKTPTAIMGVRGTKLYVEHRKNISNFMLLTGKADITRSKIGKDIQNKKVNIVKNQNIRLVENQKDIKIENVKLKDQNTFLLKIVKEDIEETDINDIEKINIEDIEKIDDLIDVKEKEEEKIKSSDIKKERKKEVILDDSKRKIKDEIENIENQIEEEVEEGEVSYCDIRQSQYEPIKIKVDYDGFIEDSFQLKYKVTDNNIKPEDGYMLLRKDDFIIDSNVGEWYIHIIYKDENITEYKYECIGPYKVLDGICNIYLTPRCSLEENTSFVKVGIKVDFKGEYDKCEYIINSGGITDKKMLRKKGNNKIEYIQLDKPGRWYVNVIVTDKNGKKYSNMLEKHGPFIVK